MRSFSGFALMCAVLYFAVGASAETVYESTDDSGAVEFSDQPSAGAQSIDVVPNVVHVTPPPAGELTAAPSAITPPADNRETVDVYPHVIGADDAVTEEEALRRERNLELHKAERRDEERLHNKAIRGGGAVHRAR